MRFEWDSEKARANLAKHGVAFEDAMFVWDDPLCVFTPDRTVDFVQRWHAIGKVGVKATLVVVHLHPDPDDEQLVRIISARKATRHERRAYEEGA